MYGHIRALLHIHACLDGVGSLFGLKCLAVLKPTPRMSGSEIAQLLQSGQIEETHLPKTKTVQADGVDSL